jgi:hypothetical protein
MTGFWSSDLGELQGTPEAAFAKTFKVIPDGTCALAKIEGFCEQEKNGVKYYEIDWKLTDGDFKGQHVFQKIQVFDKDSNKRHRALNMLMLVYKLFAVSPKSSAAPDDKELMQFVGKHAGIKTQEWSMEKQDGSGMMSGNWVSEIHPAAGFKCETGVKAEVTHSRSSVDSAFSRNTKVDDDLDSDLPF